MCKRFLATVTGLAGLMLVTSASAWDLTKPDPSSFVNVPADDGWEVQTKLYEIGCLSKPGTDGKWGESSASDFRTFLSKTDQVRKYDPKQTIPQVVELFDGFVEGPKKGCDPVGGAGQCLFGGELKKILIYRRKNTPMKELWFKLRKLNSALKTDFPPDGTFFAAGQEGAAYKAEIVVKFNDAEAQLKKLFSKIVASNNAACLLCSYKAPLDIAMRLAERQQSPSASGFANICKKQIDKISEGDWYVIEKQLQSIADKKAWLASKPDATLQSLLVREESFLDERIAGILVPADPGSECAQFRALVKAAKCEQGDDFPVDDNK
jgi:hypothetical protein